jgi:hypothetical protein
MMDLASLYMANKKEPYLAMYLSLLFPSVGHAYAGDWPRGVYFLTGKAIVLGTSAIALAQIQSDSKTGYTARYNSQSAWMTAGGMLYFLLSIWETCDAMNTAEDYNRELRRALKIQIEPQDSGAKLSFIFSF